MATTSNKRQAESPAPAAPPAKKIHTLLDPVQIGAVSSLEEMDVKVLHFQNRKLVQRLEQRRRMEEDLRNRIEQLEKRQATDDALLCIVNRYWNQLDEDMRVVLQRFDWEVADESENKNESEALTSFLASLSTWDRSELDQKLTQRVQFSERAVGKILQCFDRLMQRYEKLVLAVKGEPPEEEKKADDDRLKEEDDNKDESREKKEEDKPKAPELDEVVREEILTLQKENKNLHSQNTALHDKHRNTSLQFQELQDKITLLETENGELQNKIQDLEYAYNKSSQREDRLDRHLAETLQKLKTLEAVQVSGAKEGSSISAGLLTCSFEGQMPVQGMTIQELMHDLEEQRQLADSRLQELEKLQEDHKATVQELEKLKLDLSHLPESVIVDSAEYKCLQSQFSVLYNESMQMKTLLEETRNMLSTSKNTHLLQIEQMESEELLMQKKLRTEVIQLEDALTQVRKEYEMLRIEFEQNLVANEQTGPINREMRHLITSLQTNNQQLKGEVARYKKKWREAQSEMSKFKSEVAQKSSSEAEAHAASGTASSSDKASKPTPSQHGDSSGEKEEEPVQIKKERALSESDREKERHDIKVKEEKHDKPVVKHEKARVKEEPNVKKERHDRRTQERHDSGHERERHREVDIEQIDYGKTESEVAKNMKAEHKKLHEQLKETRLLLDMYKGAAKDQRDKVQLMVAEKKMKIEMDEMRAQIRRLQENERKDRRRLADDDAMRKIKSMEEQISVLQSKLSARKQEEDALQNELEVTGQAFEDMQEQNTRLLQQLREKDDAVFKLMSERIKSNQIHKLLKEEKDTIADQMDTLQKLGDCQNQVVQKLEEKEQLLQNNLATLEKELSLRQQAMEMHKRKAIESAQSAADLKLHLDKYVAQLRDTQLAVAEKSSSLEQENFKNKRLQEELATLRKKLERHKKMELANSADEVLLEEIRDLKEQLTCPSCKTKRKDAVFTKCFHVFCFECIKTRYDTRQRKCPKCNAGFGANDFHRLYLS